MDIRETVRDFITETFYVIDEMKLTDDSSLLEKGVVDSTGILEVITFLEEKFPLKVEETEMIADNFDSISSIAAFISSKLSLPSPQEDTAGAPDRKVAN